LDSAHAAEIAVAYASEICGVLRAEAYIVERQYNQMLIATRCYRLEVIKAQGKVKQASHKLSSMTPPKGVIVGNNKHDCDIPGAADTQPCERDPPGTGIWFSSNHLLIVMYAGSPNRNLTRIPSTVKAGTSGTN
jgi:hypothetical protein